MPIQNFLQNLDQDPEFQGFSYRQQQFIKTKYVGTELQKDPAFTAMAPGAQNRVLQQLTQGPPSLKDKKMQIELGKWAPKLQGGDEGAR